MPAKAGGIYLISYNQSTSLCSVILQGGAMLRFIAILFGIALIFAGVAGYLPMFTKDNLLLGYFEVDSMHNLFHIASGVLAIMAATNYDATKLFFKLFGLLYTAIAIWGFWTNGDLVIMHVNLADNILHIVIGVIAIYLGFTSARKMG